MAIARDNTADGLASGGSFTVGTSASGGTVVFVTFTSNASVSNATCTLGGTSMTGLTNSPILVSSTHYFYAFYMANAPTGSKVISNSAGLGQQVSSFLNTHATTPIDQQAFSSAASQTLSASAATDWAWAFTNGYDVSADLGSGPCARTVGSAGGPMHGDSNGTVSGSQTQNATYVAANTGALAFALIQVPAAITSAQGLPPMRSLMGVGS